MFNYNENFLSAEQHQFMVEYSKRLKMNQVIYSSGVKQPRLTLWVGDKNAGYTYSGIKNVPQPWDKVLAKLRDHVQNMTGARFNSVLVNHYRNGRDSVGFHADDERELGEHPFIASLSVGATREFLVRNNKDSIITKYNLKGGSLLTMSGRSQLDTQHSIPKQPSVTSPRWNYTFRWTNE